MRWRWTLCRATPKVALRTAIVVAALFVGASTAAAAFPGRNGYIFVGVHKETGCTWEGCLPTDPPFDDQKSIVRLNPRTGAQRQVCFRCTSPAVSPDGRSLAFVHAPGDDAPAGIFVSRIDGRSAHRVTTAGEEPAWSPDGKRIAFEASSQSGDTVISTIRLDGRGRRPVGSGFHPVWSSRGALAFTRFVSDGAVIVFAVFTARPDGSRLRRVSRGRFHDMAPDWAPDGRRLVFSRFVDRGTAPNRPDGLFTTGLLGRPLHELTNSGDRNAIWSPDGRLILYVRGAHNRPRPQLFVIRPDGSGRRSILPADVAIIDADWQAKPSAAA